LDGEFVGFEVSGHFREIERLPGLRYDDGAGALSQTLASPERIAAAPSDYSAPDRRI